MYETIIWGYVPAASGFMVMFVSVYIFYRRANYFNGILSSLIITIVILSEYILYEMFFRNAYPTYMPHMLIVASLLLFLVQMYR